MLGILPPYGDYMITIVLVGKARVGKTTAAEHIAQVAKKNFDCTPVIIPFAKALKDAAAAAGFTKENAPLEYRTFCQTEGEARRKDDPDYWIKKFEEEWRTYAVKDEQLMNNPAKLWKERVVIVDDCRYLNELNLAKRLGAKIVFIASDGRTLEDNDAAWRNHDSEELSNTLDKNMKDHVQYFDFIVKNGGKLEEFTEKLNDRMSLLLDAVGEIYIDCDCVSCKKFRKDETLTVEEFLEGLLGPGDEDDGA
jgi:dephospho-CoA kinase